MSKKALVIELVQNIVKDKITAEMVVDTLQDEGFLVLGYGNKDVDNIVEAFTAYFGTTKTSRFDRFAANRLATKYGSQSVVGIIKLLSENSQNKYAPIVNNINELEQKFVSVLNFIRNLDSEEVVT